MSNVHPGQTALSRRQESSSRHSIPLVLGVSQCSDNSSYPPTQSYDPTSASHFLDEFSQPQFVDLLETHSSGVQVSCPSATTPAPSTHIPLSYPNSAVLPPSYHHPPLSPSSLSRLAQPALAISNSPPDTGIPRCAVAGSLDPTTGIFYRTPEPPRLRTAQACEKCRKRKAKCSGEHPACQRCLIRGLPCVYAPEGRARGTSKPRIRPFIVAPSRDSRSARRSKETPPLSNVSSSSSSSSPSSVVSTSSPCQPLASTPESEAATSLPIARQELRNVNGNCLSPTVHASPADTVSPTFTPASSKTPSLRLPPSLSPSNLSPPLCQDSFAEGSSGSFEYDFSSYDATLTTYLQYVPPVATDTIRTGDNFDIDMLGEYLDWTCSNDLKEHRGGEVADAESLF
ncbi:hypothetical protein V8B97DRAFT_1930132 [Scleroderma yunnanense]